MSQVLQGVVRGGKIELIGGPELPEGQPVRVVIDSAAAPVAAEGTVHTPATPALTALLDQMRRTRAPLPASPTGPGRKSAAGMLTNDPTWDEHLRAVVESRKSAEYRETGE